MFQDAEDEEEQKVFLPRPSIPLERKLSCPEDLHRAVSRQRNRSLKKAAAVQDDDPSAEEGTRRAASFDCLAHKTTGKMSPTSLRPVSFDVGPSRASAFSPVEVPRLLIHSPVSPIGALTLENFSTPDNRLLTVPSPDFRKTPNSEPSKSPFACDSPKATDFMALGLGPTLMGQLNQLASMNNINFAAMEQDVKVNLQNMDCGSSLETLASTSLDMGAGPSGMDFQHLPNCSAELLAQMPSKSVIQDDIRSGNGRFQLVRKRGRSEVWNLFGQVLDNLTKTRLPFVACYACKVLYTDTGGGTGNMTRHRCPIGISYRSSAHGSPRYSSSTDTLEAGPSSFESSVSVQNRSTEQAAISHSTLENHSIKYALQNSGDQSLENNNEKESLTDSVVKICAQDLLDPQMFAGRGFQQFLERIWYVARRSNATLQEVFPDTLTIKSALQNHLRFCQDDLKNELSRTAQGVCLSMENLSYSGKEYRVVHGSRISPDFQWRSNILGVFKARENQSLVEMINHVIHNYELDKNLLKLTFPRKMTEFGSIKVYLDVKEKLREILHATITSSGDQIKNMLITVDNLSRSLQDSEVRLPFEFVRAENDIFIMHTVLKEFNDNYATIEQIIRNKCPNHLETFSSLNPTYLREIEQFFDPFIDSIESIAKEQPNFQKILPEWVALIHDCSVLPDDPPSLLKDLKTKASELLELEKDSFLTVEHRIAAVLNPKYCRKLDRLLCTQQERQMAFEKIRAMCKIRSAREPLSRGSSCDGEPHRKRRMFLNSLEDDPVADDELECYLRSQYPSQQIKDVITFWNTIGAAQYPLLAPLARRIFSIPATAPKTEFSQRLVSVAPDQLHTFLMLRSMFESLNRD